jgi:hypothetical protein
MTNKNSDTNTGLKYMTFSAHINSTGVSPILQMQKQKDRAVTKLFQDLTAGTAELGSQSDYLTVESMLCFSFTVLPLAPTSSSHPACRLTELSVLVGHCCREFHSAPALTYIFSLGSSHLCAFFHLSFSFSLFS